MSEQREELLKRLSQLAPEETGSFLAWNLASGNHLCDTSVNKAILLLAVIESIRGRGWLATLTVGAVGVHVKVSICPTRRAGDVREHYAAEPCDALLSAYVQALEATKERTR